MTDSHSYPGNVGALLAGLSRVLRVMESARQPHNKSLMSIWEDDVKDIKAVESFLENIPLVLAQGQPNLKQIEAAIDDHLGNIDATYEDSRRRCAQSILNLYAVPSTTCATPSCPEPRYVDPVNACDDRSTIGAKSQAHGCKRAGGFVDSNCMAMCDCYVTEQKTVGYVHEFDSAEELIAAVERGRK